MTEHETDKLFAALARIEARLDKLERAPDRELKVGNPHQKPVVHTGAIGFPRD